MANNKFIHISGPFTSGTEVITGGITLKKCGIQSQFTHLLQINGETSKSFEIGLTGILEFNDVRIKSIIFLQDEPETSSIDGIIL